MKYKISGTFFAYPKVSEEGPESIGDIVARTPYFDRIIQRVAGDVEQFIVLGAGYDTRAYGDLKKQGIQF